MLTERQRFCAIARLAVSDFDRVRLTALEARGTESSNDQYRGNDKVMRERQRVEILHNVSLQSLVVDRETRVTEAA
jgi:hypothetical protein